MPDESMREVQLATDNFNTAFEQACELQRLVEMKGVKFKMGFANGSLAETGTIKIKHNLFEEVDDLNRDALEEYDAANAGVAEALAALKAQERLAFKLNPLPAYGEDERLIPSSMYCRKLENALVEVRSMLTHWGIRAGAKDGTSAKDVYNADIIDMMVLVPPPPPIASPKKQKVSNLHPSSPTKKGVIEK
ncbi:hypothetical protein C8R41DRAFT_914682 [Lentinula lateritia]|uniref:Uncharacterized protein n=1 Tax=Lentinula lateritia TaxID=40482 RepID=A0ABQ8VV18_9AGAR|nr:hypothetical protein C8R41DRAFT_914682 [Lentinula lateritia]